MELLIPCLLKNQYISVYINIFHCLTKLLGALLGSMFSDDASLLLVTLKLYQKSQIIQYLLVSYGSFALRHTKGIGKASSCFIDYGISTNIIIFKIRSNPDFLP